MLPITGRAWSSAIGCRRARQQAVEHIDRRLGRDRAHAPRLGQIGDEEGLAAGLAERGRDLLDAAAIGVGLDHGGAFRRHGAAAERAPVGVDGGEIDGEDAAGLGRGRAGGDELFRPAVVGRAQVLLNGAFGLGHGARV